MKTILTIVTAVCLLFCVAISATSTRVNADITGSTPQSNTFDFSGSTYTMGGSKLAQYVTGNEVKLIEAENSLDSEVNAEIAARIAALPDDHVVIGISKSWSYGGSAWSEFYMEHLSSVTLSYTITVRVDGTSIFGGEGGDFSQLPVFGIEL